MAKTNWTTLRIVPTPIEAELIVGFLKSHDLPVEMDSRFFSQEPTNLGALGRIHIMVPNEHAEAADQLLKEQLENPADVDGESRRSEDEA